MRKIGIPSSILLMAIAGLVALGGCQSKVEAPAAEATPLVAATPQPEPALPQDSGAVAQGIGVSGRWNIEVRNPDGTVAHTRRFNNAFMDAQNAIVQLLTSQRSAGLWSLRLVGDVEICGSSTNCHIVPADSPLTETESRAKTLLVTPGDKTILLSGNIAVTAAGELLWVDSDLSHCLPSMPPEDCPPGGASSSVITRHVFAQNIPVLAGQQIMASVELRFGPGAP